jgi:hypothetical protein
MAEILGACHPSNKWYVPFDYILYS